MIETLTSTICNSLYFRRVEMDLVYWLPSEKTQIKIPTTPYFMQQLYHSLCGRCWEIP
jgi:hypothetical protein